MPDAIATDAVIVGAGPVGLYMAFQLGLQDIRCHIVDALPHAGGQCLELYADKPIYDIPGVPYTTGRGLIDSLLQQVRPFQPALHLQQTIVSVHRAADDGLELASSSGQRFRTRTLFIAAGVGAFEPKRLALPEAENFLNTQLFYAVPPAAALAGKQLLIIGDSEAALQAALAAAEDGSAASVTLLHRRAVFSATPATQQAFQALVQAGRIRFLAAQATALVHAHGSLQALRVADGAGVEHSVPTDVLLVLQGLSPKLGAIAHWGLAMERRQLQVDTETFATSETGIFAVGDINTYPGKKKLIACGFHECILAAFAAAALLHPERKILLQYTTTSTHLHALLGVENPQR